MRSLIRHFYSLLNYLNICCGRTNSHDSESDWVYLTARRFPLSLLGFVIDFVQLTDGWLPDIEQRIEPPKPNMVLRSA